MAVDEDVAAVLASKFQAIFPHLDERQRRLLAGAEARSLGHGGIRAVARAAGMREGTVSDGVAELERGADALGRVRRVGGGRKPAAQTDPGLVPALLALVEPDMRGDPTSPLRWTTKSTRNLAGQLSRAGHRIGADSVGDLLRAQGFSLQGNAKVLEGRQHPDRDAQFLYINEQAKGYQEAGDPVVSVDAKKKELVGQFKNAGRQWQRAGARVKVDTHDFLDRELGKAIPYGVYDLAANTGWVNVGTDHDTAAFAVASIRRWWQSVGAGDYPHATRLLITADAGGSNGYRTRAWKRERARQARRGTERRRAAGAGPKDKLTPADRVLATVLYLRKLCTHAVLGQLFAVDSGTVTRAVNETRPLLEQHGYVIIPSTARFPAPNDLTAFLDSDTAPQAEIKQAC